MVFVPSPTQVENRTTKKRVTAPVAPKAPVTPSYSGSRSYTPPTVASPYISPAPLPSYSVPAPIVTPGPPPNVNAFVAGDTAFNEQKAAIEKALRDYISQYNTELGNYRTEHQANVQELGIARERGLEDTENDFSGRGMLHSGLYAGAVGDLNSDFDRQGASMERALAAYINNLTAGKQNFETEQQLALQRARQEAIARRAAQYGL